jgi:hypothetical protein
MRWTIGVLVLVVALAVIGGEILLPWIVARGVEAGLERALGQGADLEASLVARPALRMLVGRLDSLTVESQRVRSATLSIDSMAVTVHDIGVRLGDLLARKDLNVTRDASLGVVIRISEANLRRYVLENVEGLSEPQFKVFTGKVAVAGYVPFNGTPVLVSIEGRFVADGEQYVRLVTDVLSIDGEQLPPRATATIMAALGGPELFMDLASFPLPLVLKEVKMTDGWLSIEAATPVR